MPRLRPLPALLLGLCLCIPAIAPNAEAFRLLSWNVLNYPSAIGATREPYMRTALTAAHPDVVVVQEIQSAAGVTQFLTNVLNTIEPGQWSAAPFTDGPDTDSALFYKTSEFSYLGSTPISTDLRLIMEYRLRLAGYSGTGAEFRVYSTHLKAGSTTSDQAQRLTEATTWRTYMNGDPANTAFVACGDFNIQSSNETSYQKLLENQTDNDGRCFDPINSPGAWYNNGAYAAIHTQSTRTTSLSDGGASGGMDDRFDFMLSSAAFDDGEGLSYIAGTYKAFGQDGLHFNNTVNASPVNAAVGQTVADALYYSSDHLPILADFQVPAVSSAPEVLAFGTVIVGAPAVVQSLPVQNAAAAPADELNYTLTASAGFSAPAGSFSAQSGVTNSHDITMSTDSSGDLTGTVDIASNDVDLPIRSVSLSGTVLDHARPSLSASSVVTADSVDFGTLPPGAFSDHAIAIHDYGFNAHQAALDVYGAEFSGDPRFSLAVEFAPATAGASPASYDVHFDDAGAAEGLYTATLTFHTRDPQAIPGAANQADLVVELSAVVGTGSVGIDDGSPQVTRTQLYTTAPNPVRWPAAIRFDVAEPGPVRLQVFDVRGRLLRTLVDRPVSRGAYSVAWNGRDGTGRQVVAGVYFIRMATAHRIEMHPAVVTR